MASVLHRWIGRHRIVSFLIIAYAFTWTIQAVPVVLDMEALWTLSILVGLGGFGPPIAAAVVIWAAGGDLRAWISQFFKRRVGAKWWAIAIGLPLLVLATVLFGIALSVQVGLGTSGDWIASFLFPALALPIVVPSAFLIGIAGWRLIPSSSTITGIIAGGWGQ